MARVTVYVTDDLRNRMRKATGDVNWSEVASRAFEIQLADIAARKKKKRMKDVVQRLRVSKLQNENEETTRGRKAGEAWARDRAEWHQLKTVAALDEAEFLDDDDPRVADGYGVSGLQAVSQAIMPEESYRDWQEFWAHGDRTPSAEFYQGFVDGARAVFEQVEDEV